MRSAHAHQRNVHVVRDSRSCLSLATAWRRRSNPPIRIHSNYWSANRTNVRSGFPSIGHVTDSRSRLGPDRYSVRYYKASQWLWQCGETPRLRITQSRCGHLKRYKLAHSFMPRMGELRLSNAPDPQRVHAKLAPQQPRTYKDSGTVTGGRSLSLRN
jgi:hypothetical protein